MLISAIFDVITIGSIVPLVATIIGGSVPSFISSVLALLFIDVTSFDADNSDIFFKNFLRFCYTNYFINIFPVSCVNTALSGTLTR